MYTSNRFNPELSRASQIRCCLQFCFSDCQSNRVIGLCRSLSLGIPDCCWHARPKPVARASAEGGASQRHQKLREKGTPALFVKTSSPPYGDKSEECNTPHPYTTKSTTDIQNYVQHVQSICTCAQEQCKNEWKCMQTQSKGIIGQDRRNTLICCVILRRL